MTDTLSIRDFIQDTIEQICDAVESARQSKSYVAPQHSGTLNNSAQATNIDFDLAVTVAESFSDEAGGKKKLGLGILRAEAGIEKNTGTKGEQSYSSVSRIKFSVPVYFQYDEQKKPKSRPQVVTHRPGGAQSWMSY